MPSHKKRTRRRNRGYAILPTLIAIFALIAAVLIVLLIQSNPFGDENITSAPVTTVEIPKYINSSSATVAPLVLAQETPQPTAVPVVTQPPIQDDAIQLVEGKINRLIPKAQSGSYFLPVFDRALRTPDDEMMIALTIDNCNIPKIMSAYVSAAMKYDAKLTFFPIGEALADEKMKSSFARCVLDFGYEIENYPYNRKSEYNLSDGELTLQLWKQNITLSYILNTDYQQHFFRPINIESTGDQRTHYLLSQMGLLGMGSYTYNYETQTIDSLKKNLKNGNIYRFDMTEKSLRLFKQFIQYACSKGYKCVTMNRLFGLNEDVLSGSLTLDQQTLPSMDGYQSEYYDLKVNSRSYAVLSLQTRLAALGYLKPDPGKERYIPDGLYGSKTSRAVSAFQAAVGMPATGNADIATQQALFTGDAPLANANAIIADDPPAENADIADDSPADNADITDDPSEDNADYAAQLALFVE